MELKKSDIIPNKEPGRNVGTAGFSLIEISIVLVIIGILVSVSIAGLNIVRNVQADKVVVWVRGWEQSMLSFLDRRGRFAGDADRDGIITGQALAELATAGLQNLPSESIIYVSTPLVMHIGKSGGDDPRNVIVITCLDTEHLFADTDLIAIEAIDTRIDGSADSSSGLVRGYEKVTLDGNGTVTSLDSSVDAYDEAVALAYFFDRPPADEDGFLYYDPFDSQKQMDAATTHGEASNWTVNDDGTLNATGNGYALVGDASWDDYTVSADISLADGMKGAALLYRASSDNTYYPVGYGVQIDNTIGNKIVLRQYNGAGGEEKLAEVDYPEGFDPTASNTVTVKVSGNTHVVSINGEVVITYTDDKGTIYSSGQVGFRTWDSNEATMDNLTVSAN